MRALIDPCSEATLVTLELIRRLGLRQNRVKIRTAGVFGSASDSARVQARILLCEPTNSRRIVLQAFGLGHIGIVTPQAVLSSNLIYNWKDLTLADPQFHLLAKIDAILEADALSEVMLPGITRRQKIIAQSTIFGWTLSGVTERMRSSLQPTNNQLTTAKISCVQLKDEQLHYEQLIELIQRFWALEEIPHVTNLSRADIECEDLFKREFTRDPDGRYVVPFPIKREGTSILGDSFQSAIATL